MNKEILTRKELYDMVWSNSIVSLSKKYVISDSGLRKICKRMNIPLPENGHWVKIQFGKKVRVKPLPASEHSEQTLSLTLRTEDDKLNATQGNPKKQLLFEIQNDPRLSFTVPEKLKTKDPLILAAKLKLTGSTPHYSFNYKDTVESSRDGLDIRVAPKNAGRALRFMDTMLKLLRGRGHSVIIEYDCTKVLVKGQELKICFREKMKRVVVKGNYHDHTELHPIGILSFRVNGYDGKEWKDGKQMLEHYPAHIIAWMEMKSDQENELHEYYRKEREAREELERIAIELRLRKDNEFDDFKIMLAKAERWHKAVNLRNYIDEVERNAVVGTGIRGDLKNWLDWARKKANWYDPFVEEEDELMENVDRNLLS